MLCPAVACFVDNAGQLDLRGVEDETVGRVAPFELPLRRCSTQQQDERGGSGCGDGDSFGSICNDEEVEVSNTATDAKSQGGDSSEQASRQRRPESVPPSDSSRVRPTVRMASNVWLSPSWMDVLAAASPQEEI